MGKGVCVGELLWLGHPKVEHPISFGELLGVPQGGAPCSRVTVGATSCGLLGSGPGRGAGMLWGCGRGCGAQWPFVCRAAPGTSRHPSFPVT